jgi:hypothetical protein
MALVVTCKSMGETFSVLDSISRSIAGNRIPDWARTGTNVFQNTRKEYAGRVCFIAKVKENELRFGIQNPSNPALPVSRSDYDSLHSMFFSVLVHLSWIHYFRVEQSPDRIEGIDAKIDG